MTKRKSWAKVAIVALAVLLCLAIALGITGAWYKAQRNATGTIELDQGIIIDYSGFSANATQTKWGKGVDLLLFEQSTEGILPGETIDINEASIGANAGSIDFYARYKLTYKFYSDVEGNTPVELANPADLITVTGLNGSDWTLSGDGYYYYAADGALKAFTAADGLKALFGTDAAFHIEGPLFVGIEDGEGGAFVVNETTSISRIEVYLTLEALQATEDAVADEAWAITDANALVIEESLDAFEYIQNDEDKTLILTKYKGSNTAYEIKSTYPVEPQGAAGLASGYATEEYTVIGIGDCTELNEEIYDAEFADWENYVAPFDKNATKIILPNTVTQLGVACFGYSNMTEVVIPGSVDVSALIFPFLSANIDVLQYAEGITELPFSGMIAANIGELRLPSTLSMDSSMIGYAFVGTDAVDVWDGTPNIGAMSMPEGDGIYEVKGNCLIEKSTKKLLVGCSGSVIPADGSVEIIGEESFRFCKLTSIVIPDGVTTIDAWSFTGSKNLKQVEIGKDVTSIGDFAFYNYYSKVIIDLETVIFRGTTPPTLNSAAISTSVTTIIVPSGCTDAYRAALTNYNAEWGASVTITELPAEA